MYPDTGVAHVPGPDRFESGATAALFGPVASVVGGEIGTLAVVAFTRPVLRAIGPLHTLRSRENSDETETV